jgi:hypothetical protein
LNYVWMKIVSFPELESSHSLTFFSMLRCHSRIDFVIVFIVPPKVVYSFQPVYLIAWCRIKYDHQICLDYIHNDERKKERKKILFIFHINHALLDNWSSSHMRRTGKKTSFTSYYSYLSRHKIKPVTRKETIIECKRPIIYNT